MRLQTQTPSKLQRHPAVGTCMQKRNKHITIQQTLATLQSHRCSCKSIAKARARTSMQKADDTQWRHANQLRIWQCLVVKHRANPSAQIYCSQPKYCEQIIRPDDTSRPTCKHNRQRLLWVSQWQYAHFDLDTQEPITKTRTTKKAVRANF